MINNLSLNKISKLHVGDIIEPSYFPYVLKNKRIMIVDYALTVNGLFKLVEFFWAIFAKRNR